MLRAAEVVAGPEGRSGLIERAVRRYLKLLVRRSRHHQDLAAIANCDQLILVPKAALTHFIGSLPRTRLSALRDALRIAVGVE